MISIIDSACAKSIRPFKKARFVNSPGSASRAPANKISSSILLVTKIPPWQLISTISSAVNVFGARMTETKTSSTFRSVSGSYIKP